MSECLEGTIRTVLENLTLSAEAIQQKTGANLDFVQHLEQTGNELRQVGAYLCFTMYMRPLRGRILIKAPCGPFELC